MKTPLELLEEIRKDFVEKHDGDPTIDRICKTVIGEFKLREEQLTANDSEYCTCRVRVEGLHYDFEGKPYCADCTKRLSKT